MIIYRIGLHQTRGKWIWTNGEEEKKPPVQSKGNFTGKCAAIDSEGIWQATDCNISLPSVCKTDVGESVNIQ